MVYYELTIKCPNGCTLSVPSDNMPTYLERHTRICASGDQELHALREALERHDWSNHSVANAMKTVSNKEKYAEFQGDVCTFLGVYSKARELPKHLSQLRNDERLEIVLERFIISSERLQVGLEIRTTWCLTGRGTCQSTTKSGLSLALRTVHRRRSLPRSPPRDRRLAVE